jgi:hypothetical protein
MCLHQELVSYPTISLEKDCSRELVNDLRSLVHARIKEVAAINEWPSRLITDATKYLLDMAEGIFLGVAFALIDITDGYPSQVMATLFDLPQGLQQVYASILGCINPQRQKLVHEILSWVLVTCRPLNVSEPATAFGVIAKSGVSPDAAIKECISSCRHFSRVDQRSDEVRFYHASDRDFLG